MDNTSPEIFVAQYTSLGIVKDYPVSPYSPLGVSSDAGAGGIGAASADLANSPVPPQSFGAGYFTGIITVGNSLIAGVGSNQGGISVAGKGTDIVFWAGSVQANRATAPFRVDAAGNLVASSATLSGSITSTGGSIGGFDIGADYIRDVANSMGLASTVTGGDDVRFWAGTTYAGRATAPFRVTESGAVVGSSITITGGSVATSTLNGTIALGNLNVANRGWSQSSVFSVTDADTVSWGAGTFTAADGTAYSISGGNTGNMVAKTYIYLDTAISTTAYQTTTTATTAIGAGKVLIAVAQNGTGEATFQVLDGQGGQNIDAANIVANSITANELSTSITYAGSIIIDTAGLIRSGQTNYDTGTGWWLGNASGTPKFSIGNSSGNKLTWDGTTLTIKGNLTAKGVFGGDGSDGALSISSGTTTINLGNAKVVTKNYTSISITGTGKLAFSNPHATGTFVILKSQGAVVLTSSTNPNIDLSNCGAPGGAAGSSGTTAVPLLDSSTHGGASGTGSGGGAGGTVYGSAAFYTLNAGQYRAFGKFLCCGSGGGGGRTTGTGAGGSGGGSLVIECAGDLNCTGNISVAGSNGTAPGGAAGGGGGSGGTCLILYDTATATSGTVTDAGGTGGQGTDGNQAGGGGGGIGGAGGNGEDGSVNNGRGGGGAGGGGAGANGSAGGAGGASSTSADHYIQI